MKILLVEPEFPIPPKSKNHRNFLPIGLLKLASYYRKQGERIKLVRGNKSKEDIRSYRGGRWWVPDKIMITSLFTYWAKYVRDSVRHYKNLYPEAKVVVGGVYASLMPEHCKEYTKCDEVFVGVHEGAEKSFPAYDLIENNPHPLDYQIVRTSRGCTRSCEFCGVSKIESSFKVKNSMKKEIKYRKIVFYDDNLLANPCIEDILNELIELKNDKKILWCEAQSGFDGRILKEKPPLATMIKKAGFHYPRIAWDSRYEQHNEIKDQLNVLLGAGYKSKDIFVFMLYNWDIPFEEMEKKRLKCWEWQVQIADCRFRPLDCTYDKYIPYIPLKRQDAKDYYIHPDWMDAEVKQFRKNVRRQNICVRHSFPFYSEDLRQKRVKEDIIRAIKRMKTVEERVRCLEKNGIECWIPDKVTYPSEAG